LLLGIVFRVDSCDFVDRLLDEKMKNDPRLTPTATKKWQMKNAKSQLEKWLNFNRRQ